MWRKILRSLSGDVEREMTSMVQQLRHRLGADSAHVVPYRGFGTWNTFHLRGRVLEGEPLGEAEDNDTVWENLVAMYRRIDSDEIPGIPVTARFEDATKTVVTDDEGYFALELDISDAAKAEKVWFDVSLSLAAETARQIPVQATGEIMVPPANSQFGVISDLDDTVLQTHATNLIKMARVTFLNNARTRLPFAGVSAFYRALQLGSDGQSYNPLFYVSSSPWNLYDLLVDFMRVQNIPAGPLFLRDIDLNLAVLGKSSHHNHKSVQIERILTTYPHLPFVLIGDSGQHDPEIYREVVHNFPDRVRAIYIRDVSVNDRDRQVDKLIEEVAHQQVDMVRVADTFAAAEHAAQAQLVSEDMLATVFAEKEEDKNAPSDVEIMLTETV